MMVLDVKGLLKPLQWGPDMVITNHFGERVWLKEAFNRSGKRAGITDCCPESAPCPWHKALAIR